MWKLPIIFLYVVVVVSTKVNIRTSTTTTVETTTRDARIVSANATAPHSSANPSLPNSTITTSTTTTVETTTGDAHSPTSIFGGGSKGMICKMVQGAMHALQLVVNIGFLGYCFILSLGQQAIDEIFPQVDTLLRTIGKATLNRWVESNLYTHLASDFSPFEIPDDALTTPTQLESSNESVSGLKRLFLY